MGDRGFKGTMIFHKNGSLEIESQDGKRFLLTENADMHPFAHVILDDKIFTEDAHNYFLELPEDQRLNYLAELLEQFYRDNPDYANFAKSEIYKEPNKLLDFFKSIKESHFKRCGVRLIADNGENRFNQLQTMINQAERAIHITPIDATKLHTIWPILRIRDLFTESEMAAFYSLIIKQTKDMRAGKERRQKTEAGAIEQKAIMELRGSNLDFFSNIDLWDAYSPKRIYKIGSLDPAYIDNETGAITKANLEVGKGKEVEAVNAYDIPLRAHMLLTAINKNTVDNVYDEFVKDGVITFYVKGVLESYTGSTDPRMLTSDLKNLPRDQAGYIYLERLIAPLQGYIGQLPNGSRWSLLNYVGYDQATDTMKIMTPYTHKLWTMTQKEYFDTRNKKQEIIEQGKKAGRIYHTPLKLNSLFKNVAINENETTLEIAYYITNKILQTGGTIGKKKKTEFTFNRLIEDCPRLDDALNAVNDLPAKDGNGKSVNRGAYFNAELKKIKSAIDIIQDPKKCDFLKYYEIIDMSPAKINKDTGRIELIPPTKKKINDLLTIIWQRKGDPDLE